MDSVLRGGGEMNLFLLFLASLVSALVLLPVGIEILKMAHMGQYIQSDGPKHATKSKTPTSAGIWVFLIVVALMMIYKGINTPELCYAMLIWLGYMMIGFYDDLSKMRHKNNDMGLSPRAKIQLQSLIAILAIYGAHHLLGENLTEMAVPLGMGRQWSFNLGILYYPFAFFMMLGASNAFNITDGLDGLLAGLVCMVCCGFLVLLQSVGIDVIGSAVIAEMSRLMVVLIGVLLGFIWFNCFPASVFLGDSGSLGLGALLSYIAILLKVEIFFAVLSGVLIAETVSVILQVAYYKYTKGKRIFKMAPLHHHYELSGIKEPKIVIRFWIVGLIFLTISLCLIV